MLAGMRFLTLLLVLGACGGAQRPPVPSIESFYCFSGRGEWRGATCSTTADGCDTLRSLAGGDASACAPRASAYCYDEDGHLGCYETADECRAAGHACAEQLTRRR